MTYTEFYTAYDLGKFKPTTSLSVKLLGEGYTPKETDGLKDLTDLILTATGVLTFAEFQANGMSEIMRIVSDRAAAYRELHPDRVVGDSEAVVKWYVVYSGGIGVVMFSEEVMNGN